MNVVLTLTASPPLQATIRNETADNRLRMRRVRSRRKAGVSLGRRCYRCRAVGRLADGKTRAVRTSVCPIMSVGRVRSNERRAAVGAKKMPDPTGIRRKTPRKRRAKTADNGFF